MRKSIPKSVRDSVRLRFGGRCGYCGSRPDKLQIDHIRPVSASGVKDQDLNAEENLMPACFSCNNYKMNMSLEQFRTELAQQVWRARTHSLNFRLAERFGLVRETEAKVTFYFEQPTEVAI